MFSKVETLKRKRPLPSSDHFFMLNSNEHEMYLAHNVCTHQECLIDKVCVYPLKVSVALIKCL